MVKKSIRLLIADDNRDFCELLMEFSPNRKISVWSA